MRALCLSCAKKRRATATQFPIPVVGPTCPGVLAPLASWQLAGPSVSTGQPWATSSARGSHQGEASPRMGVALRLRAGARTCREERNGHTGLFDAKKITCYSWMLSAVVCCLLFTVNILGKRVTAEWEPRWVISLTGFDVDDRVWVSFYEKKEKRWGW